MPVNIVQDPFAVLEQLLLIVKLITGRLGLALQCKLSPVHLSRVGLVQQPITPRAGAVTIAFVLTLSERTMALVFTKPPTQPTLKIPRIASLVVLRQLQVLPAPIYIAMSELLRCNRRNPPPIELIVPVTVVRNAVVLVASLFAVRKLQKAASILLITVPPKVLLDPLTVILVLHRLILLTAILPFSPAKVIPLRVILPTAYGDTGTTLSGDIASALSRTDVPQDPRIALGAPSTGCTTFTILTNVP